MKINVVFLTVLCSLVISTFAANAQKVWTLEECIDYAMKNNLQLMQSENTTEIAEHNLFQSKANTLPSLNGNGSHNYNFGRNIDPFTNQYTENRVQSNNFSLNSSLILFNGSQVRNNIKLNQYEYMASNYQLEVLKNNISLNIAAAYLDILFNRELLNNAKRQTALTKVQYENSEKLVNGGTLTPTALFDLRSQLANEEAQVVRTENALKLSYLNLAQLLNLSSTETMEVVLPESLIVIADSTKLSANENEIVTTAIENQPQIKFFEYRRLSSLRTLNIERGRQSPRLLLNASLSTLYSSSAQRLAGTGAPEFQTIGYTQNSLEPVITSYTPRYYESKPFDVQLKDNYSRFLGLSLSVPILNSFQVRTAINRAKINAENAELDLKINKISLENTVRKSYVDAQAALSNFKASGNSVKASEEALRNMERRLEVGLSNPFEYNQAKTRFAANQSDLLRAKYDYIFKLKILDFYKGQPLKL